MRHRDVPNAVFAGAKNGEAQKSRRNAVFAGAKNGEAQRT